MFDLCTTQMSQKIRFAVEASLAVLSSLMTDEPSESAIQRVPTLPLSGWLYLWTFTTPDKVDLPTLSKRWKDFSRWSHKVKAPYRWLRVFEPHEQHGYHVHAVAAQRYDVRTIRQLAEKSGFGRLNVTRIPAHKAAYVVKYLVKHQRRQGEKGVRMWACNGFKGVSVSSVRITDSWYNEILAHQGFSVAKDFTWKFLFDEAVRARCCHPAIPRGSAQTQMNDKQKEVALSLVSKGAMVRYVEFRQASVREAAKFIDGRRSLSEKTYYNQFFLESGGKPTLMEEKLPDAYVPGDEVKAPMKRGQTAVLEVTKVRDFKGAVTVEGLLHAIA